jgi:hypothetical protein
MRSKEYKTQNLKRIKAQKDIPHVGLQLFIILILEQLIIFLNYENMHIKSRRIGRRS